MAKKKTIHNSWMTIELQNILAGGILITLSALMFLATKEASVVGGYFSILGEKLFGVQYRWIFSPLLAILGTMILVKRASWSASRLTGIILFFLSVTSLLGLYARDTVGFFDLHEQTVKYFGRSATILGLLVLFFASLWMTLRISYRTIFSKLRESTPSLSSFRNAVLPDEDEDDRPLKKPKLDETYKRKSEELERKLANIQKSKSPQKEEKTLTGRSILSNAFSGLTKKVPIETPDGKIIESRVKQQSLDFGTWDFPSTKLLNQIEHRVVVSPDEIEEKSLLIEKTLLQFGIDVDMEGESVGPTVIQYRLRPSE